MLYYNYFGKDTVPAPVSLHLHRNEEQCDLKISDSHTVICVLSSFLALSGRALKSLLRETRLGD